MTNCERRRVVIEEAIGAQPAVTPVDLTPGVPAQIEPARRPIRSSADLSIFANNATWRARRAAGQNQ